MKHIIGHTQTYVGWPKSRIFKTSHVHTGRLVAHATRRAHTGRQSGDANLSFELCLGPSRFVSVAGIIAN